MPSISINGIIELRRRIVRKNMRAYFFVYHAYGLDTKGRNLPLITYKLISDVRVPYQVFFLRKDRDSVGTCAQRNSFRLCNFSQFHIRFRCRTFYLFSFFYKRFFLSHVEAIRFSRVRVVTYRPDADLIVSNSHLIIQRFGLNFWSVYLRHVLTSSRATL